MARRMAAMQAFLNSLTPEQRAQLSALSAQLLDDMDLRWQVDRLQQHLQGAFPGEGWGRQFQTRGRDPLGMAGAVDLMERLGNLDQLENLLSSAPSPGALAEVDFDVARDLLGDDGAASLERLAELARMLTDAGLIENREGRLELTPRGLRAIGRNALGDLFQGLEKDRVGRHAVEREGPGHERAYSTKPYEWGDPFNLDIQRTLRNAVTRGGTGTPVALEPEDFEVERTETLTRSSTVLLLDLSLSMPMKDNFLAAKKVAVALHSLISTQYPRDFLGLVVFGEVARTLRPAELPRVSWDFNFGTNIQHALLLARQMLSRQPGTRQVLLITDGEPTAHILPAASPSSPTRRRPRRCGPPWPRWPGARPRTSASTRSCSTPPPTSRRSSSAWPSSTGAASSSPPPKTSAATSSSTSWSRSGRYAVVAALPDQANEAGPRYCTATSSGPVGWGSQSRTYSSRPLMMVTPQSGRLWNRLIRTLLCFGSSSSWSSTRFTAPSKRAREDPSAGEPALLPEPGRARRLPRAHGTLPQRPIGAFPATGNTSGLVSEAWKRS